MWLLLLYRIRASSSVYDLADRSLTKVCERYKVMHIYKNIYVEMKQRYRLSFLKQDMCTINVYYRLFFCDYRASLVDVYKWYGGYW